MKLNKTTLVFIILFSIILVLLYILIFKKPKVEIQSFDDTVLKTEIQNQEKTIKSLELKADSLLLIAEKYNKRADSLQNLIPKIKKYYNEKYKFNSTATTSQLDSIIRSGW